MIGSVAEELFKSGMDKTGKRNKIRIDFKDINLDEKKSEGK